LIQFCGSSTPLISKATGRALARVAVINIAELPALLRKWL
jgi:hypothetical protein